jgi:hypothetical protein
MQHVTYDAYLSEKIMNEIKTSVIVTYKKLNEAVTKALSKDQTTIMKAAQTPPAGGWEADDEPPTAKDIAELTEELSKALKVLEEKEEVPGVFVSADDRFASLLQSFVAEGAAGIGKVEAKTGGEFEAQFDEHDVLGWTGSLLTWIKKLRPHQWQTALSTPDQLSNSLRVAVLGDWGSGLYGAPVCAASIQNDSKGYGMLLHLGDVYYSGTDSEIKSRFLNLWPKIANTVNRACNANHEMYTGGYAYFNSVLKTFTQPASYFALQNDHWLLVGLDSAYKEWEFANDQIAWFRSLIQNAGDRKVILFTHHQLFSWANKTKGKMAAQLAEFLTAAKIFAWYWGHEHRCMIFDRHAAWGIYGRCIGHSGYPYFTDKFTDGRIVQRGAQNSSWRQVAAKNLVPGGLILQGPNLYVPEHENKYGPNGYLTLEFDGTRLNEIVQAPDGSELYNREVKP